MNTNGDVVTYLNLTSVRPEDGGRYTCRAHNTRGSVDHSTRLNVYGKISDVYNFNIAGYYLSKYLGFVQRGYAIKMISLVKIEL